MYMMATLVLAGIGCTKTDVATDSKDSQFGANEEVRSSPNGGNSGPSANGQGGLLLNDRVQHFAFHATTDKNGIVSGSWESKSPGQDIRTHGTITCLQVLPDGKTAIMSGIITQRSGDGFPGVQVGDPVWFKVVDNGEGANSVEDLFSDYFLGVSSCNNFVVPLQPIVNGNIQVKP